MPRSIMLAEDVRDEGPRHRLILRDIVISVETTSSQAEERGHSLLDEMHILPVHGLLHLLGFDHEISDEAEAEMEKEEELLLNA
ncbi:Endoribonuclease YbeY [Capsicum annuum]|nr:Endoribonuclease YbeY [Capsicum annuum]